MTAETSTHRTRGGTGGTRTMSRRGSRARRPVPAESVLVFSSYEPRDAPASPPAQTPRPSHRGARRCRGGARRKETFVEANARFALRPGSDTLTETMGGGTGTGTGTGGFNWEDVECVFVERESDAPANAHECPISLELLVSPKITPCGHIFSHVSLLQHVAHSADDLGSAAIDDCRVPVKCPLCSALFTLGELKDVAFRQVSSLRVGSTCSMQLVSSYQDVVQPYNKDEDQDAQSHDIPRDVEEIDALFSRFCVASKHFLCDLFTKCLSDLRQMLVEDSSLKRYVDAASKHVRASKQAVHQARKQEHLLGNAGSSDHGCSSGSSKRDAPKKTNASSAIATASPSGSCNQDDNKATSTEVARVFYQASDARNVFLHPINHRCLAHEYGSDMRQAELTLSAKVVEVERHTMDETARRRYRFLRHLPNGCVFALIELDLSETLKPETLSLFARELESRRAGRKQKRARDRKEDESAGKQRDEALHAYFRLDRVQARPIAPTHDDEDTFPTLTGTSPGASTRMPVNVPGASDPTVSSYSSVTTNMGLFPALAATDNSGTPTSQHQHPQMGTTPPRGVWAIPTPPTHTPLSTSPTRQTSQRRQGRTRYTKVLSNAGATHRK